MVWAKMLYFLLELQIQDFLFFKNCLGEGGLPGPEASCQVVQIHYLTFVCNKNGNPNSFFFSDSFRARQYGILNNKHLGLTVKSLNSTENGLFILFNQNILICLAFKNNTLFNECFCEILFSFKMCFKYFLCYHLLLHYMVYIIEF